MSNLDPRTVRDFGREWKHFDQSSVTADELRQHFEKYFRVFPWYVIPKSAVGFDLGCGSGWWARRFVSDRVRALHCIDASSEALEIATRNLSSPRFFRSTALAIVALIEPCAPERVVRRLYRILLGAYCTAGVRDGLRGTETISMDSLHLETPKGIALCGY